MKKTVITVLTAALLGLAACSSGPEAPAEQPAGEVTVSTPPDTPSASPTPSEAVDANFKTAVEFTTLVHDSEYETANELVKSESPAARYLAHQVLSQKADVISGVDRPDDPPEVEADKKSQSVKVTYDASEPVEGERAVKALTYTWKDFTFEQGKITGWTGATGPIKKVLWTRETSDESEGRKAVLKSAYRSNNKNVTIIVELSSKVATGWTSAEYTAKDGYRQVLLEEYSQDLSKGEKTLGSYTVEKAEFGGELHIPFTDAEGFDQGELLLTIK